MSKHKSDCACCQQGPTNYMASLERIIQAHGHAVIATATDYSGREISMAHTIGLYEQGLPELLVFGLPQMMAMALLNDAAAMLKRGELSLTEAQDKLANLPSAFVSVEPAIAANYIYQANLRANRALPVWQLVWTDTKGNFPWHVDYESRFKEMQPVLDLAAPELLRNAV